MEATDRSCVYGLRHLARSLTAVLGDKGRNRFLVGTQDVRKDHNEVHVVEFDEDRSEITSQVYRHAHEILSLVACPARPEFFFSCYAMAGQRNLEKRASLWRLPESGTSAGHKNSLTQLLTLEQNATGVNIKNVLWDPTGGFTEIVTVDDEKLQFWSLGEDLSSAKPTEPISLVNVAGEKVTKASWSLHNPQIAVAVESNVRGWDMRSKSQTFCIEEAHSGTVRDMDYNPNVPCQLATGGDDCKVRVWDTRNCTAPLREIANHTHWVWSVSYNHYHDQLLLTTGSDCLVNLHSVVSISSAQHGFSPRHDEDSKSGNGSSTTSPVRRSYDKTERLSDGIVQRYDQQHEESVYCGAWSAADPWIFATLSYDGRLVVNFVPNSYKNTVLLAV